MDLTWSYSKAHKPSAPVVRAAIGNLSVELVVDSGFSGGVLLPFPHFQALGLMSRLVPEDFAAVLPDRRKVEAYTAMAQVTMGKASFSTLVHASPMIDKSLLGREALKAMDAKLDGPNEALTFSMEA